MKKILFIILITFSISGYSQVYINSDSRIVNTNATEYQDLKIYSNAKIVFDSLRLKITYTMTNDSVTYPIVRFVYEPEQTKIIMFDGVKTIVALLEIYNSSIMIGWKNKLDDKIESIYFTINNIHYEKEY